MCKECGYHPCIPECPNYENNGGYCENCYVAISNDDSCYGDSSGHLFCSKDCFEEYYGFEVVYAYSYDED